MSHFSFSAEEDVSLATSPACTDFPWKGLFEHYTSVTSSKLPGKLQVVLRNRAGLSVLSYVSSLPLLSLTFWERPGICPFTTKTQSFTLADGWLLSAPAFPALHPALSQMRNAEALLSAPLLWKKKVTSDPIWLTTCRRRGLPKNGASFSS